MGEEIDVAPERLKAAVMTSGPVVKDIEALLGRHCDAIAPNQPIADDPNW